jgi:hypothetical protein
MESDFNQTILGEVVNISSKGLLFKATEALVLGEKVTAFIDWPAYLDERVQLQLVVEGQVVRSTDDCTAIRIARYEFRTRGATRVAAPPVIPPI